MPHKLSQNLKVSENSKISRRRIGKTIFEWAALRIRAQRERRGGRVAAAATCCSGGAHAQALLRPRARVVIPLHLLLPSIHPSRSVRSSTPRRARDIRTARPRAFVYIVCTLCSNFSWRQWFCYDYNVNRGIG